MLPCLLPPNWCFLHFKYWIHFLSMYSETCLQQLQGTDFFPCCRQVPFSTGICIKLKILMTEFFPLKEGFHSNQVLLRQISLFMHVWCISFYSLYDHIDDAVSQSLLFSGGYTLLFLPYVKLPKFPPCLRISQWYCIFIACANSCTERSLCHYSLWYNNCKLRNVCCLTH